MQGRVLSLSGGNYQVMVNNEVIVCRASGRLRSVRIDEKSAFAVRSKNKNQTKIDTSYIKISPKVGDLVVVDLEGKYILDVVPRKNMMIRPDIANVDQIILLSSAKRPDFSFYLLDLFLVNIEKQNIDAKIVVSKIDLLTVEELNELKTNMKYYENLGYEVFYVNSKSGEGIEEVEGILHDKISVLAGQTGAGKSSFINAILPGFQLKTDEISKALNRGKHTTRVTSLYEAYGGFIGDTPGFSKLDISQMKDNELMQCFKEFRTCRCRFKDCLHLANSMGCEVIEEVKRGIIMKSRYENYLKMLDRSEE